MGLARSTFYDEPKGQLLEAALIERIKEICAKWPAYGYRRALDVHIPRRAAQRETERAEVTKIVDATNALRETLGPIDSGTQTTGVTAES